MNVIRCASELRFCLLLLQLLVMASHATSASQRSGSSLVARNVRVAGRRTSVRLEPSMWEALQEVAEREGKTINDLVTEIDRVRPESTLTAAIRVHLLAYYRRAAGSGSG
jgi:predicted DNA-binding ribbon-helix-helix protein